MQLAVLLCVSVPDEPPRNVSITLNGVSSAIIRWMPPPLHTINGEIKGYNIKYKDLDSRKNKLINLDGEMTQYQLEGIFLFLVLRIKPCKA